MPLPVLVKTWRFNSQQIAAPGSAHDTHRLAWWAVYNALRGQTYNNTGALSWTNSSGVGAAAPSVLWTTDRSCNSLVAGTAGDNVNRLLTFADIVHASDGASAHSWGVLKNTAIGAELCMDFMSDNFNPSALHSNGFMTSMLAFPTGGTTTARPTATDENRIFSATTQGYDAASKIWLGDSPNSAHVVHTWASTDGECWRIVIMRAGYSVFQLLIEKPQSPVVLLGTPNHTWNGLDQPYVAYAHGAATDGPAFRVSQYPYWHLAQERLGTHMGNFVDTTQSVAKRARLSTEFDMYAPAVPLTRTGRSDFTNKFPASPLAIISQETGFKGRMGVMTDLWAGTDTDQGVAEGDNYPDDLTRQFVALGAFIYPWNSTVMLTS